MDQHREKQNRVNVKQRPYGRLHAVPSRIEAEEVGRMETEKLLAMNVMETAQTEWPVPMVLVYKNDGSLWLGIDYCELNSTAMQDSYAVLPVG